MEAGFGGREPPSLPLALSRKEGAHAGNMVSPVLKGPSGAAANMRTMRLRLVTFALVVAAVGADASGEHALAYYALVACVPAAAVAGLAALGAILDHTAAEPADRASAVLSAILVPFLLLATAVRAPLLVEGPPPAVGVAAVVCCVGVLALQGLLAVAVIVDRARLGTPMRSR